MESSGAGRPLGSRRGAFIRIAAYACVLAVIVGTALVTGSLPSPEELRDWGDGLGDLGYVAFVPLFVLANFVIAWPILAGAAGLLFGTAVGTPLALAGLTAASLAQMFVSRRLAAGHQGGLLAQAPGESASCSDRSRHSGPAPNRSGTFAFQSVSQRCRCRHD